MENNNWEPKIGQKVVSLITGYKITKGDVFTVIDVIKGCHTTFIDIGIISEVNLTLKCNQCGSLLHLIDGKPFCPEAKCFAPINPYSNSISLELAKEAVKENIEVDVPMREVVNKKCPVK
jgi:hypothetical protein